MEFRWFVQTNTTLFLVFTPKPRYEESFESMDNSTFANRWNLDEIESNYQTWLKEPASLDSRWQIFFEGFQLGYEGNGHQPTGLRQTLPSPKLEIIRSRNTLDSTVQSMPTGTLAILRVLLIPSRMRFLRIPGSVWKDWVLNPKISVRFILPATILVEFV